MDSERRGRLATDNRWRLVDEGIIFESRHHEAGSDSVAAGPWPPLTSSKSTWLKSCSPATTAHLTLELLSYSLSQLEHSG